MKHLGRDGTIRILMIALAVCTLAGCSVNSTLKAAGYYDTRGLPTGTVTGSVTHAEHGTRLYSFSNVETNSTFPKYLEAILTQPVGGRISGVVEYNRNFNVPAGTHRFGLTYQPPLPQAFKRDRLAFKYTPFSTHGRGAQLNFTGAKLFGAHMYLEWFFDYDLKPDQIVTDWQFGRRLRGPVYAVVEYRYNGLQPDSTGVGIGLEWKMR